MAKIPKPRKKPPTRLEIERFVKTATLKLPMELVLEWDRPVSVSEARQASRRLLESLTLEAQAFRPKEPFASASLRSPRSARILRVHHGAIEPEADREPDGGSTP